MNIIGIHGALEWDCGIEKLGQVSMIHDSGCTLFSNGKHVRSVCLLYTSDAADE